MTPQTPMPPRLDAAPEHTCGTTHRAGVITVGCPGCTRRTPIAPSQPIRVGAVAL
ncbi:hypothetical protein [Catenulispora pinisilvae]|uniref:hypothetical protein n=1 Tax=Catenulispora pinisilvae TaxID=2705253 RepID=UPI00189152C9|nr:hypothetical protein [Catenulispora pinisilvae]